MNSCYGYGLGPQDCTGGGNPIPQAGELWELHSDGYEHVHFRVERHAGYTVIGEIVWTETGRWVRCREQLTLSAQWDACRPRLLRDAATSNTD